MQTIDRLFEPEPDSWGLRGDPYLWRAMKAHFSGTRLPLLSSELVKAIEFAFFKLTGKPLETLEYFSVEAFAHGGMSSGGISPEFWREEAIPLLLKRQREATSLGTTPGRQSEKSLDQAIEAAFKNDIEFVRWFLGKTKFRGMPAKLVWSRSDHPWTVVDLPAINPLTGATDVVRREGETDVLVVFETPDRTRVALHIENKRGSSRFTARQPELYAARAAKWRGNKKYGNYDDWQTVLVAPIAFIERYSEESKKFDLVVPHEEIAAYVPEFGAKSET